MEVARQSLAVPSLCAAALGEKYGDVTCEGDLNETFYLFQTV
jgi:hypothetical protein